MAMVNEADLVFGQGKNKVMLTLQHELVQSVIHDFFEIVHSSLLFTDAFPDSVLTLKIVKGALIRSTIKHEPGAASIHRRLLFDKEYLTKIMALVSFMNVCDH